MWYHKKFNLQYDKKVFNEIIEYAERATWRQGYDQNGLLWNVEELPLNPKQFPIGINYVIVNGEIVIVNGENTGKLPGEALSKGKS